MRHYMKYEGFTFQADKIKSGNVYLATSLLSSSLEVNSLIAEMECSDPSILNFRRNAKLLYYAKPDQPMTFRVQNIERVGSRLYRITLHLLFSSYLPAYIGIHTNACIPINRSKVNFFQVSFSV